ncbi:MAG: hypothetical protein JWN96_3338, partial [Mycobacterium sp.]|nr:hypothetical protein [Mycobacterium sp.]
MSEHQEGSSSGADGFTEGSSAGADGATDPTQPQPAAPEHPASPFARPPGYAGNVGYGPPAVPPIQREPRFAGAPYAGAPYGEPEVGSGPPTTEYPAYPTSYGQPVPPWQPPGASYPPPGIPWGAPQDPVPHGPARSRKPWLLVTILVLALVAGGTTIGLVSTDSKSSSPTTADPNLPSPLNSPSPAPSTSPSPNSSGGPSSPLPNVGIPTPPGLLAIGYHAYSSGLRAPADVAIDSAEEVQFK